MARVLYTKEAAFTEETLKMTNAMVLSVLKAKMEKHTTESGTTMKKMVLGFTSGQMGAITRGTTLRTKDMDKE